LVFGRTLIIGMAFGLVLAGRENPSGNGPSPEELAVWLAESTNNRPKGSEGGLGKAAAGLCPLLIRVMTSGAGTSDTLIAK
jgi:hypothetical protein